MKQYKVTIGTISKGFREETYLLKDDVLKLIKRYFNEKPKEEFILIATTQDLQKVMIAIKEELIEKINGENKK